MTQETRHPSRQALSISVVTNCNSVFGEALQVLPTYIGNDDSDLFELVNEEGETPLANYSTTQRTTDNFHDASLLQLPTRLR